MPYFAPTAACFRKGFTLIELSIVLVIIGLVAGGVVVGRDMIKAAELRAVITEQEKLQTAIMVYKAKFNAIPGDHANAQQIFGATTCPNYSGNNRCNGNGNGLIRNDELGGGRWEHYHVSQHLALAGLIDGSYTSEYNAPKEDICKKSVLNNGYWIIMYSGPDAPVQLYGWNGHYLGISDISPTSPSVGDGPVISPIDAYSIDAKIDDGDPGTGRVMARDDGRPPSNPLTCTTSAFATSAEYFFNNNSIDCVIAFKGNF